jgi:hypothetical protein
MEANSAWRELHAVEAMRCDAARAIIVGCSKAVAEESKQEKKNARLVKKRAFTWG